MLMQTRKWPLLWMIRGGIALTLCVIVLGAYTRLSDAGLGCPDWPGCYGQLGVPNTKIELEKANKLYPDLQVIEAKAWPEMIHRYFAGSLGLLVFFITLFSLNSKHHRTHIGRTLPVLLTVIVIAQALLGMWTVTLKLMPIIVVAHLLGGFALLSLLVLLQSKINPIPIVGKMPRCIQTIAAVTLISIVGQIFLGGWTSSNYAALMCTSLPICQGDWTQHIDIKTAFTFIQSGYDNYEFGVLDYAGRMTIHISHRFGAILVLIIVSIFCWRLSQCSNAFFHKQAKLLFFLLFAQITLGISNVLFHLPLFIAVLHNLGSALLLITTVRLNYFIHTQVKVNSTTPSHFIETDIRRTHE